MHASLKNYPECVGALTECIQLVREATPPNRELLQKLQQQLGAAYAEAGREGNVYFICT
jgi:hypothetical protein